MTRLKTAQFVVPLIALGKWKVFAGLQIHAKTILTHTNKAGKALEEDAQGEYTRRVSKTRKARRHVRHKGV